MLISVNDSKTLYFKINTINRWIFKNTNYLHIKYYVKPNFYLKNSVYKIILICN